MLKDFLIVVEAASTVDLHAETVRRFCRTDKLRSHKLLNYWLISRTEVESFASAYLETRGHPAGSNGSTESAVTRSVPQRK